jgi:O-antigen/teichoic acid export membrane protein
MADTFIIEKFVNVKDVGLYSIARNLSMLIREMASAIKTAWIPFYMRVVKERNDYKSVICRSTTCYSAGMAFLCFGLAIFAREIIIFLGREAYIDAIDYIPCLLLANFIAAHEGILECGILMANRTKYLSIVPLVEAGCIICLSLLLVPTIAVWGSVISVLIAATLSFGILYRCSIRAYPISFDRLAFAKMLVSGLLLYLAVIWIQKSQVMLQAAWSDIVAKAFLVVLYACIVMSFARSKSVQIRG